jgi:hypothetical protein
MIGLHWYGNRCIRVQTESNSVVMQHPTTHPSMLAANPSPTASGVHDWHRGAAISVGASCFRGGQCDMLAVAESKAVMYVYLVCVCRSKRI